MIQLHPLLLGLKKKKMLRLWDLTNTSPSSIPDLVSRTAPMALRVDLQLWSPFLLDFSAGLQPRTCSSCNWPLISLTLSVLYSGLGSWRWEKGESFILHASVYQPSILCQSARLQQGIRQARSLSTEKPHSDGWITTIEHSLLLQDVSACAISFCPDDGGTNVILIYWDADANWGHAAGKWWRYHTIEIQGLRFLSLDS